MDLDPKVGALGTRHNAPRMEFKISFTARGNLASSIISNWHAFGRYEETVEPILSDFKFINIYNWNTEMVFC